jgi:uncharacterized phage protein (TIGR01671 family)
MREIKFRAWDESQKYMAYQGTPDLETLQSFIHHYGDEILMQFTGLTDSTGREIYEGDALKVESEKHMIVGWSKKFASFVLNREGWAFSHWFGESCNPENCKIIGNIHENPELLK